MLIYFTAYFYITIMKFLFQHKKKFRKSQFKVNSEIFGSGAANTFVASLPIPLEIKAPATALASTVTGAILLYWKNKVNKQ